MHRAQNTLMLKAEESICGPGDYNDFSTSSCAFRSYNVASRHLRT